jgi:hypothetical protein
LKVYDTAGREVETLVDRNEEPGLHLVEFNAGRFASGVYMYRLQAGNGSVAIRKALLIR